MEEIEVTEFSELKTTEAGLNENTALIEVVQLPEIVEHLSAVKERIEKKVNYALSLECNEETYKEIKNLRAELNSEFKDIEALRIAIKKQILSPYEEFEKIYKPCVTDVFKPADVQLANKINYVTDEIKRKSEAYALEFFTECCYSKGIDFLKLSDVGLNITMNISNKKIRETITNFVNGVAYDLEMINTQEFADEILVEYKKSFNASQAIITVTNHHKEIEAERQRRAKLLRIEEERKLQEAKVEQAIVDEYEEVEQASIFSAPMAIGESDDPEKAKPVSNLVSTAFKATGSMEQLKGLTKYMKEKKIHYERI